MKILIVTGLFYPSKLGGPANTLFWLSKGLVSIGHEVSVISSYEKITDTNIKPNVWVNIDRIKSKYCCRNIAYLRLIKNAIKEIYKNDIIMLSSVFFYPLVIVALFATLFGKEIIWSPRGELSPNAINNNKIKKVYLRILKKLFVKKVYFHSTAVSESTDIKRIFGNNINLVEFPNYMIVPEKKQSSICDEKYILYLGRIAPIKCIESLILGIKESTEFMNSKYVLKIAGGVEPQFKDYYEYLILLVKQNNLNNKVQFVGPVYDDQKYLMYSNAYFSFLVSKSENFGNVVIESMSQGTPVVTSQGTPWRGLIDNKAGFWINNTPKDISDTIDKIINLTSSEYEQYRYNALQYAKQFDIFTNVNKIDSILNRILHKK